MGIRHIHALKPGDDADPESEFVVTTPDSNGVFSITGSSSNVTVISSTRFTLNSSFVTTHGDGSYTATTG